MNPYEALEERAFWAPAVGQRNMLDISDLWRPRFVIDQKTKVVTFGSCFAQHFASAMTARGFGWVDEEPGPQDFTAADRKRFNFSIFSARTANIYTTSLLLQWTMWALKTATPPGEVWERDGRFFDPFRPAIEPDGFASVAEMTRSRAACIAAFRRCILGSDLFVFTLGLTESWWHREDGYEYPMCPGTVAGTFDADRHVFLNQDYPFVLSNLEEAIAAMRGANPDLKFLLTVSPVPLTATKSGNHVLVATTESKSTLRSVAAAVQREHDHVDYFPSYEIIGSAPYRATFFEPNMRSVNLHGVGHVMDAFFAGLPAGAARTAPEPAQKRARTARRAADDLACEEELLGAMASGLIER